MLTRTVDLTQHLDDFITAGIEDGRYGDVSDAIREGLRLLEEKEDRSTASTIS